MRIMETVVGPGQALIVADHQVGAEAVVRRAGGFEVGVVFPVVGERGTSQNNRRNIAKPIFQGRTEGARPQLVRAGVEHSEGSVGVEGKDDQSVSILEGTVSTFIQESGQGRSRLNNGVVSWFRPDTRSCTEAKDFGERLGDLVVPRRAGYTVLQPDPLPRETAARYSPATCKGTIPSRCPVWAYGSRPHAR